MQIVETGFEALSVITALFAAYYWYKSTIARAKYIDDGQFVITDTDEKGRYDVLETSKLQVKLNKPAALMAAVSAGFQAFALVTHLALQYI